MSGENRFYMIILCAAISFLQNAGYARGLQYPTKPKPLKSFLSTVGGDAAYIFSAPFRLKQGDGFKILAFTAVTAGCVALLDQPVQRDFSEGDDAYIMPALQLSRLGDTHGEVSFEYILAGLPVSMLAGGIILRDTKLLQTGRLMIESYLFASIITQAAKRVFGRERPYTSEGPSEFEWFQPGSANHSFPSGHTTAAFAVMTVLAKQYSSWWVKIPAYTIAASVAFQRIQSNNHWGTDVIVGGAIGYLVGSALVNRYNEQILNSSFSAYLYANGVGVMIRL